MYNTYQLSWSAKKYDWKGRNLEDCPICYEKITKKTSTTTRCKHVFHKTCLQHWTKENTSCPMCRATINEPLTELEEVMAKWRNRRVGL